VRLGLAGVRVVTLGAVTVKPPEGVTKVTAMDWPVVSGIAGVTVIGVEVGPVAVLQVGVMEEGLRMSCVLLVTDVGTVSEASASALARNGMDGVPPLLMPAQPVAVDTV
jgi:hypothetical protein